MPPSGSWDAMGWGCGAIREVFVLPRPREIERGAAATAATILTFISISPIWPPPPLPKPNPENGPLNRGVKFYAAERTNTVII